MNINQAIKAVIEKKNLNESDMIDVMNTNSPPAATPGSESGKKMRQNTCPPRAPKVEAALGRFALIFNITESIVKTANGINA